MDYGLNITLDRPFHEVVVEVREALTSQGFGVVSEIDMQATLKNKLDVEIEPYLIWGACAPQFAYRALQAEPSVGLLLPCNVVIRRSGAATIVEMINSQVISQLAKSAEMTLIADEISVKLKSAMDALRVPA